MVELRRALVAATAAVMVGLSGAPALAAPAPGGPGVGDVYFPDYGNSGYDVSHYDVRLRYQPTTDRLTGTTTILGRSKASLSRFNLDFLLDVSSVQVNGRPARFARSGVHELVVTPSRPLSAGEAMTVVVQYSGVPSTIEAYGFTAWTRTADGAQAVGEPEVAWWWFPSNDHPRDKATFDISVAVPNGVEVLSNGVMPDEPRPELRGWTRWSWRTTKPMATYLAFVAIGQYEIHSDVTADGLPTITAYATSLPATDRNAARASVERTAEIVEWGSTVFGPYPFEAVGGVAGPRDGVGFALENQTRPVYGPGFWRTGANPYVVVHENAHQWFGDSVSVAQWRDIWLNEGFASYAEWLWSEQQDEGTAQQLFDYTYANYPPDHPFWQVLPGDPGADRVFHSAVYDRGAMTLHQLRLAVGDAAFFTIARRWAAKHRYGDATTAQFIALAEKVSGKNLKSLFKTWLFTQGRPAVAEPARLGAVAGPARLGAVAAPASWAKIQQSH